MTNYTEKPSTDLDRLHDVVSAEHHPRGIGRTFAACHNLAGILETCEEKANIVWLIPQMSRLHHIRSLLERVLIEHELLDECEWVRNNTLKYGTKYVDFLTPRMLKRKLSHYNYRVDDFGELYDFEKLQCKNRHLSST